MSLFTLSDLDRSLRAYVGNDTSPEKSAAIRRAAAAGVRELASYHDWPYYQTLGRVNTVAAYSTGTVAYDHTGGASERLLTLASGTFPDWAGSGVVEIAGVPYDVSSRLSSTTLQLSATSNPGADVASGTEYRVYRMRYQLPADFSACSNPVRCAETRQLREARVHEVVALRNANANQSGGPAVYCFLGRAGTGGQDLFVWPPSDAAYALEFVYQRQPAQPTVLDESAGKVAVPSTTVTGTGTQFSQRHVGCVFRASYDSAAVEPIAGVGVHAHEATVTAVASATSLTLDAAPASALSNVRYALSSPLDVEVSTLWDALVEMCRKALRIELRMNVTNEEVRRYQETMQSALAAAGKGRERKVAGVSRSGPPWPYPSDVQW